MTTVGEFLQNGRIKKRLTLEQVERATKIRVKFLSAIEKNQFDQLPDPTFAKGFIRNYAIYLGLSTSDAMAFYRRAVDEGLTRHLPVRGLQPLIKRFALTPQVFTGSIILVILALFFGYLAFSYFSFAGAPMLDVITPKNNSVLKNDSTKISGRVDPDATMSINGQPVLVSKNGSFSVEVTLQPGLNTFVVTAVNKYKRETKVTRNVRLEK